MKDQLEQLFLQAQHLWFEALAKEGGMGDLTMLLARIANDLQDAKRMAEHPGLKQIDCYRSEGDEYVHASSHSGEFMTLCWRHIDLEARTVPERRVPTCPRCIAILTQKDGLGGKS